MEDKNFIKSAMKVIEVEGNAVLSLVNQIESDFENLCMEIINTNGKLVLMGIGKSGHIAQKISATLSSTGTPSFFIHPTEAAHGDLGMIDKEDAVLILSNSGETKEIIDIYPITYKVRKDKNENWLIINIIVNGVNLGLTFRNQFQALAAEHDGDIEKIIRHWTSDANLDT